MPLDGASYRTTEQLALTITEASCLVVRTRAQWGAHATEDPHFSRLHRAYGAIKRAVYEAKLTKREAELAQALTLLGYSSPIGRACRLFGLPEKY